MNEVETAYFKDSWKPDYSKFEYSGWQLLEQFKPNDQILDCLLYTSPSPRD